AYLRSSGDEVVARKGTGQVKVFARNRADAVVASNRRGQVLQTVRTYPTPANAARRSVPPSTPEQRGGSSKNRAHHPTLLQCREHPRRILRASQAAVVPRERIHQVAALPVEVEPQDRAAVAQVGALLEEVLALLADLVHPERHHLHEAAGAGVRDRVLAEFALDV